MVLAEPVATELREDDQPLDPIVVRDRHQEHRLGTRRRTDQEAALVGFGVGHHDRLVVRRDPAREAFPDSAAEHLGTHVRDPHERALEGDRLTDPVLMVDAVDADVVEIDQLPGRGHDGLTDRGHVGQPAEAATEVLDRLQPRGQLPGLGPQPGIGDGRGDLVGKRPGELELLVRPRPLARVVEGQNAERGIVEDDRHEAGGRDPVAHLGRPDRRAQCRLARIPQDLDLPPADAAHQGIVVVEREPAGRLAQSRAQSPMGGQPKRLGDVGFEEPHGSTIGLEQVGGRVDDVGQDRVQVGSPGDLAGNPAKGVASAAQVELVRGAGPRQRRCKGQWRGCQDGLRGRSCRGCLAAPDPPGG